MKPYLSLVIPYHNSVDTIGRLLTSITKSKNAPQYEVIVVDDGSNVKIKDQISKIKEIKQLLSTGFRKSFQIVTLEKNVGPAIARNRGVAKAKGTFVVFLDGDVELFPDTLHNLAKVYKDDPDVVALTGVWVKEQRSKDFFPNFKALRDWSYWINERDKSGYYFLFSTRIASIKKSVFQRLGGFDEQYPAPLVEDIELTYRIARRYAIIFAPHVRVRHEFESFWPIAKKYFLRAYYWTRLYTRRKKFDPVATTAQEAITTLTGVGTVVFGVLALTSTPVIPLVLRAWSLAPLPIIIAALINFVLFVVMVLVHLFLIKTFLIYAAKENGMVFAVKSFFVGLVLYCFIFAGAVAGRLKNQ